MGVFERSPTAAGQGPGVASARDGCSPPVPQHTLPEPPGPLPGCQAVSLTPRAFQPPPEM